jgi:iron complex transport system substrate-binding protein
VIRIALLFLAALSLTAQPKRIISTAPSITEMLYALGLGDRVVAVTTYCHYPEEAKSKPTIGTYLQPNFETILSLKPDLVIVVKNPVRLAERLREMRLNVIELSGESLSGIAESIRRIGDAAQVPERAIGLNAQMKSDLAAIENRTRNAPRRSMIFIVSRTPGRLEQLMAVGEDSFLNELIRIAGGENILGKSGFSYPKISLEHILTRNPEVIVDMGEMAETTGVTQERKQAVVQLWKKYPSITGRVYAAASDIFVVAGPRVVDAAREFAKMLHPELGF